MLRLDRQHLRGHRRRADAAVYAETKKQPVDGAEQGARPPIGKAGLDDRRGKSRSSCDGRAELYGGPGYQDRPEAGAGMVKIPSVSAALPAGTSRKYRFL